MAEALIDARTAALHGATDGEAPHPMVRTTTLVIENMHCGGCLAKVEGALGRVRGVAHARANLSQRRVAVAHDTAMADVPALVDALARAGFRAAELMATLPGERLYRAFGYVAGEPVDHPLPGGLTIRFVPMRKPLD